MRNVLKSRLTAGILILTVVCLGIVFAGDVIVKEGIGIFDKIGIGTTSPSEALDLASGNLTTTGSGTFGSLTVDADTIYVDTNYHRVGIGTTNPGTDLDVEGHARIGSDYDWAVFSINCGANKDGILNFSSSGEPKWVIKYDGDGDINQDSFYFKDHINDIVRMLIDDNGKVGIGTTSPSEALDLASGNLTTTGAIQSGSITTTGAIQGGSITTTGTVESEKFKTTGCTATGTKAVALGYDTEASGDYCTAFGYQTTADYCYDLAMGYGTTADGGVSTAMGYNTHAGGILSTTMGYGTTASGDNSVAMGNGTDAIGTDSTAMGNGTTASGSSSIAMGYGTTASGSSSTAMGANTEASGSYSTAMGGSTEASGPYSTAMGSGTIASGDYSTAMGGFLTTASGDYSIAMGEVVAATAGHTTAIGKYSINDVANSFTVGYGAFQNYAIDFRVSSDLVNVYGDLEVDDKVTMGTLVLPVKTDTGDPASPVEGQIYVNTADNKVRVYADGAWRDLATW